MIIPSDFRKKLLRWYQSNYRRLPWRETSSSYQIWVSEVMLQQTTVKAVVPYYTEWIKLFPDIESLSKAPLQAVLKAWQGLGYYQRVKNMHKASKIIMDEHNGMIPQDYDELKKLPGFGPYITAAVLSLAFNKPYPVIDANVRRVLMRMKRMHREASPKYDPILIQFISPHIPQRNMGHFNQAMMELGALICRPKNPSCLLCLLTEFCKAYEAGEQEIIPRPKKRNYRKIEAVVGIIKRQQKYLIQKRPPKGLLADLWEFPGGKRKKGESREEALRREIKEELDTEAKEEKFLTKVHHAYTQFQVTLYAYECRLKNEPHLRKGTHRWTTLKGLKRYPMPSGSVKIVRFLEGLDKK